MVTMIQQPLTFMASMKNKPYATQFFKPIRITQENRKIISLGGITKKEKV